MKRKIRNWMENNFEDCRDHNGEINCTQLAENCAHFMKGGKDEWLDDEIHIVWDVAIEFDDR